MIFGQIEVYGRLVLPFSFHFLVFRVSVNAFHTPKGHFFHNSPPFSAYRGLIFTRVGTPRHMSRFSHRTRANRVQIVIFHTGRSLSASK